LEFELHEIPLRLESYSACGTGFALILFDARFHQRFTPSRVIGLLRKT